MEFIGVNSSDSRIVEYNRAGASLPANTASTNYVEISEADKALMTSLRAGLIAEGREPVLFWNGQPYAETDTRPIFDIVISTANPEVSYGGGTVDYITADGVSEATVTITMVDGSGATVPFTGSRVAAFFDGRLALLNYVDGVAVKTFTSTKSGLYTLKSTPEYKLTGEVSVLAVEV